MVPAGPLASQLLVVEVCQNALLTRPVRTLNTLIKGISLFCSTLTFYIQADLEI